MINDTSNLPPTGPLRSTEETLRAMYPPKTRPVNIHESIDRALDIMKFQRSLGVGPWGPPATSMTPKQKLGIYDE
jgi:hypothetical protein